MGSLDGRRGSVFEVPATLYEDAAVKRLQLQGLLPAVSSLAAEEDENDLAVGRGEVPHVSQMRGAGRARSALPVRSHRPP